MWKPHLYRLGPEYAEFEEAPEESSEHRRKIEPWLSALFQSEHLSLLIGNGFTTAIAHEAGVSPVSMSKVKFDCELEELVNKYAEKTARNCGRNEPNIEDQIRSAIALATGLEIMQDERVKHWENAIHSILSSFLRSILKTEREIRKAIEEYNEKYKVKELLISFLLSFASRSASRERLNLFTTNYDRLIEYGCDLVGIRIIDRFVGTLSPIFRSSRLDVDIHYNPPGIRGEPRYLEGVIKFTKLHGSIDWRFENFLLKRYGIPFGADDDHPGVSKEPINSVIIYPNPAKDVETTEYPYAELFRDFSHAICRPNSVLVTYGYGFGDDHINRIIRDMLTIPSTHLLIISYDDASKRIPSFCEKNVSINQQVSLLIGSHFGNLPTLVEHYLPKPAIDRITLKMVELIKNRDENYLKQHQNEAKTFLKNWW